MTIKYNRIFRRFLSDFELPHDLSFSVNYPKEIAEIIDDEIIINKNGISLGSNGGLGELIDPWENYSIMEDYENHFHVDGYVDPPDTKQIFMLGIRTLIALAEKFENRKIRGIRLWYSFQTSELGEIWSKEKHFHNEGDVYLQSDRLSFYKRRKGEDVVGFKVNEKSYWARMIIDI